MKKQEKQSNFKTLPKSSSRAERPAKPPRSQNRPAEGQKKLAGERQNRAFLPRPRYIPSDWEDGLTAYLLEHYRPAHGAAKVNDPKTLARLLGNDVAELAEIYNHARGQMKPNLFQKTGLRAAYLAHYFLLNAARNFAITGEIRELLTILPQKIKADAEGQKTVRLLDLGSGPGSAGLAWAASLLPLLPEEMNIEIDFVDKAPQLLADIGPLARSLGLFDTARPRLKIRTVRGDILQDAPKVPGGYHIILMANILNEVIGASRRSVLEEKAASLLSLLKSRLSPDLGFVTVIEPATKECTTTLLTCREVLKDELFTLAPCLHDESCRLLVSGGKDWCHSERAWTRPQLIEELDHVTSLDHTLLRWSYWVFTPWAEGPIAAFARKMRASPGLARLVSGFIPVKSKHCYKLQLCTAGELALHETADDNPACLLEEATFSAKLSAGEQERAVYPRRGVLWFPRRKGLVTKENSGYISPALLTIAA